MYIAFIHSGYAYCMPASSVGIGTSPNGEANVWEICGKDIWNNVESLQAIDCAQNAIAWLGHGVDTEGHDHRAG